MNITQNKIKETLSDPCNIKFVYDLLESTNFSNRTALALHVCEHFKFYDTRGMKQQSGCLKALRVLEKAGHFTLPTVLISSTHRSPKRLDKPVPLPINVPEVVGEVKDLELVLVNSEEKMRIWNELMINEHPQKAGPLVGRQFRYLIRSAHGWLGGIGFASAALQLADRDNWIGWNFEHRQKYLHFVINMSRFLIRPSFTCRNLASKILSMSLLRLPVDFEKKYKYRPLLVESFVDDSHYLGSCYKAANWIEIGKTKGRGRQDRFKKAPLSIKSIYVYPLEDDFRTQMDLSPSAGRGPLAPEDGLESSVWAENEFGGAPLEDARLSKRLVKVAAARAEVPDRAYTGVAKGDWPAVKAYYRMIDQPEKSAVTMSNILAPHRSRTEKRMAGQKVVLCIQDGSDLNYNNLNRCEGLGEIGFNQTSAKTCGLHLHSTLAVASNGIPLGVLRADCTAPQSKSPDDKRPGHAIPIEEKKTFAWIEHYRDLVKISSNMPRTRIVNMCDREADFFEMFDEQRKKNSVDLLIRAKQNRNLTEDPFKLFTAARQAPALSQVRVNIPRKSARKKKGKQKASSKQPSRTVDLTLRAARVQVKPPETQFADKDPLEIWVINALEENPPDGTEPLEWFLLTTIPIISAADIEQCLRWYCLRWRIEDWHRVLKSGCRIEDLQHTSIERLQRAIGISLVIAWRIMLMTLLGREVPDLPAEVLFSDIELRTLRAYAKKKTCLLLPN